MADAAAMIGALRRWLPRRAAHGRIVFLGDSITESWPAADPWLFGAGWINAGISGDTTAGMRARFALDVIAAAPDAVHIMGGTNDLWHGHPGPEGDDTIGNLAAMIDHARSAGIAVILAPLPPISAATRPLLAHAGLYELLGRRSRLLAAEKDVVLADYAMPLCDHDGRLRPAFTTDGIHLTAKGYRTLRATARRAIASAL